jgi:outer membrane protein OmpA-like peptidoglycan-associated protein
MRNNRTPIINPWRILIARWTGAMGAFVLSLGLGLSLVVIAGAGPADAQLRRWGAGNEVFIDLTVLDGGVRRRVPAARFAAPGAGALNYPSLLGLLEPPSRQPSSRLLVSRPPGVGARSKERLLPAVKLRKPGKATRKTRRSRRRTAAQPIRKPPARAKVIARRAEPAAKKPGKPAHALTPAAKRPAPVVAKPKPAPNPAPKQVAKTAPPPKPDIAPPPPAAAPKPAANAPSPAPKPQRQASLPKPAPKPAAAVGSSSVAFAQGDAELNGAGKARLDSLAARLKDRPKIRMQLLAYAGGDNLSASKARRLSLSRALAIRSYLIGKGVRSTRIDVRALGSKVPGGKPDRVDLKIIQR